MPPFTSAIASAGSSTVRVACCLVAFAAAVPCAKADVERETPDPILRLDLPGHTAEVRSLAFLPDGRLVSGGRDKVAMIWDTREAGAGTRDIARARIRDRVIRWQVARGTRGVIQAVAVSPDRPAVVALGGSGAMGSTGEIVVVDQADGGLVAVLGGGDRPGHRGSVVAVDFAVDGGWLFSSDVDGQVFAWRRNKQDRTAAWAPVELLDRDEKRLPADQFRSLQSMPATRPLAAAADGRVALPTIAVAPPGDKLPPWRITLVDPAEPAKRAVLPFDLRGTVLAMDATPDGRFLAAADLAGRVAVWDLAAADPQPVVMEIKPAVESLALSADGGRLIAGVATQAGSPARLEVWDTKTRGLLSSRTMAAPVRAVAASATGATFAAAGGWNHEIILDTSAVAAAKGDPAARATPPRRPARRLGGVGRRIGRVAFATQPDGRPPRRLALTPVPAGDAAALQLSEAFDLVELAVVPVGDAGGWAPAAGRPGRWSLAPGPRQRNGFETWQLLATGRPAAAIELDLSWQGRLGPVPHCVVWLARENAADPWGVALGTDRGVFVYELADEGLCRLVRRYRGHEDGVLSLAVSEDGRWLASGGRDGLVMLWPSAGIDPAKPLFERFGIGLRIENGRAVVDAIDEAGPLAGRDVRVGDVIAKVSWADGARDAGGEAVAGPAVVAALTDCPWSRQLAIVVDKEGKAAPPFNRLPAWENIASLHLAANREWAWWSPRGYYAASANGDTLFGWLVNRGVEKLPRFFRANQFRRKLERPDVMSRLLTAGSLGAALRTAGRDLPKSSAVVLPELIVATPEVSILSPRADMAAGAATLRVTAAVEVPAGGTLSRVRAYASGVVGREQGRVVDEQPAADGRPARRTYAWDLPLPDESEHLIQVFAGTEAGPTDVAELTVAAPPAVARPRRPRLFLLAAGVDRYAHADRFAGLGLTNLSFATADARAIRAAVSSGSASRYAVADDVLLADAQVTRAAWREALATAARQLADDVAPDDLVVLFLAGHGMIDDSRGRDYCYLCHDAELVDLPTGVAPVREGTITWQDFAALDALPCRKLALVDTCHSGGMGPSARSTSVREFQENMILVLAAASDAEASQESDVWGHGAFTTSLLEALAGRADTRSARRGTRPGADGDPAVASGPEPDGVVTLAEIADYVIARVPELTTGVGERPQHPTVSPASLVPFVTLPLADARVSPPAP
jgi:WD40 repeat protein